MPWESGLAFPSPSSVAAPLNGEAGCGSEYPYSPREAISLVCEAVPGAKGATRRRKVCGVSGAGRHGGAEHVGRGPRQEYIFLALGTL